MIILFYFLSSFIVSFPYQLKNDTLWRFSKCDYCGTPIKWYYNIPIFSGLFKTRCCKKVILKYSFLELLVFGCSIFLYYTFSLYFVFLFYLLYILSIYDILHLEIHYPIFFLFIFIEYYFFPHYKFSVFLSILLLVFSFFNKIGFGDVVFLSCSFYFVKNIHLYLLIACFFGLCYCIKPKIPFLPACCLALLISQCLGY